MKAGMLALSPIAVFLVVYVAASIIAGDFYKVPISVAFLLTSIYAIAITRGDSLRQRITLFSQGAGQPDILLMIWIFILAGAFAASAKTMGAIDATVQLSLQLLPDNLLLAGLFLSACFISLSIGTSVGTVVALVPIAAGIADATTASVPMVVGVVVGGAFFGDNLSFISDTTIMATRTQGCRMSDKFRVNSRIVTPAAILVLLLYIVMGTRMHSPQVTEAVDVMKVLPYVVVLVTAIAGLDVMLVLVTGLLLSGIIGIAYGSYDLFGWFGAMGEGILGMGELIIVTMLAGGLMALIRHGGGLAFIIRLLTRRVHSSRGAERGPHRPRDCRALRRGPAQERQPARHILLSGAGHHPLWRAAPHGRLAGSPQPRRDHTLFILPLLHGPLRHSSHPLPSPQIVKCPYNCQIVNCLIVP